MCLETDSPDGVRRIAPVVHFVITHSLMYFQRKFYEAVGFIEKGTYTFQAEAKLNATCQMWSYAQEL